MTTSCLRRMLTGTLAAAGLSLAVTSGPAVAQDYTEFGTLTCESVPRTGVNLIIRSTQDVRCVFETGAGTETYRGETGIEFGVDLTLGDDETLSWLVFFADTESVPDYALAGRYVGASATVALGLGAGVDILANTENDGIVLQPVAVRGGTGVGAALGIGYLYLEPDV